MSKFFRSKSKAHGIKDEGERLPSSYQNDSVPDKSAETLRADNDAVQLTTMNSKEVGKKIEEEELTKEEAEADEGIVYPGKAEVAIVTLALVFAVFMVALDQTIIATAIPRITDEFDSLGDVGWYGSAYLLTSSSFQLFFGRLYVLFPVKWMFVLAVGIFALGSVVAGAAPSSAALIVGRAISGLGCAGMMAGAFVIIAHAVPLRQRPVYTGIVGSFNGVASVVGPLLGGAFTDHVSWRWCFYINLPFSGATIAIIAFLFKDKPNQSSSDNNDTPDDSKKSGGIMSFDPVGTLLLVPAVVCLLLALQWGGSQYAWNSARIIALLVVFGVLILGFAVTQYFMQNNATVPPRILKQRSIGCGAFYTFCAGAALFIIVYYLPMYFQVIKGTSALKSGVDTLPLILSLTVMSLLTGGFVTAIGYYVPAMILGSILKSIGSGLISTLKADTNHRMWIGSQICFGFGGGLGAQQALIAAQTVLPLKDVPFGIAILNFAQTIGGAVFISVAQNVFANSLISNLRSTSLGLDPYSILSEGALNIRKNTDPQALDGVLLAYNNALSDTYKVAIVVSALTILGALGMEWRSVKPQKPAKDKESQAPSVEAKST